MRHTLLPDSELKRVNEEYHIRAITLACLMLASAGFIGIVALFPAYIDATLAEQTEINVVTSQSTPEDKVLTDIRKELGSDSVLVSALTPYTKEPVLMNVISGVLNVRGTTKITSVSLSRAASSSIVIIIQGVAAKREDLLTFKNNLQNLDVLGKNSDNSVNLPVEELKQSTNISFSLQLITKKHEI